MDFLSLAFVFLIAGVIAVPLATKFGLGSVLGYLIAGIAISPLLTGFGVDVISLQHFAEFGVVMMLFLVGLELEPKLLWQMRIRLMGLGGLQVGLTTVLAMGAAMALGQPWSISLAIGLILALSSTAIVLQTLNEKGLMKSDGGQASFSVLLFQDIAVIPMLAFIPLLALPELMPAAGTDLAHGAQDSHGASGPDWIETIPGWHRAALTVAAIAGVVVGGSLLTRPVFRFIAMAKLRELFTATALLMVIGIALLMSMVGLSPALGTFLAGVVLANSEYRHELQSDIDPFKGLLLGLFFMTVGAGINFGLLFENFAVILALTLGLIALKVGVLMALAWIFGVPSPDKWLFSLGLAQAGEFGFVLISFSLANHVIPTAIADQLLLVVALSMLLTPLLFIGYDQLIAARFSKREASEPDEIDETSHIIIAGHGRWGSVVNRMLLGAGYKTVVLDHNSALLEMMRAFNFKVFYGDPSRPDLLHSAGIDEAKLLVVAIDDRDRATEIVHHVSQHHPHVHIIARARDRNHVYELYAAGCRDIVRETFDSGVRAGRSAFEALGQHPYDAELMARGFVAHDLRAIRELAPYYDNKVPPHQNEAYLARTMELRAEAEAVLARKAGTYSDRLERGWLPPDVEDVEEESASTAEAAEKDKG